LDLLGACEHELERGDRALTSSPRARRRPAADRLRPTVHLPTRADGITVTSRLGVMGSEGATQARVSIATSAGAFKGRSQMHRDYVAPADPVGGETRRE